jgi:hypothetical protein
MRDLLRMEGYHLPLLPGRLLADDPVVAVHHQGLGPCGFVVEDSSSYSGAGNTVCKADLESTERDRSHIVYMPVRIVVLQIPGCVKLYVDLGHLCM